MRQSKQNVQRSEKKQQQTTTEAATMVTIKIEYLEYLQLNKAKYTNGFYFVAFP